MDNHYHLLLETPAGNLPQIMRHINGAYTTDFNIKRDRAGYLVQGRYQTILVEKDACTKELSRYIHLNPVKLAGRITNIQPPPSYWGAEKIEYREEGRAILNLLGKACFYRAEQLNLEIRKHRD